MEKNNSEHAHQWNCLGKGNRMYEQLVTERKQANKQNKAEDQMKIWVMENNSQTKYKKSTTQKT